MLHLKVGAIKKMSKVGQNISKPSGPFKPDTYRYEIAANDY